MTSSTISTACPTVLFRDGDYQALWCQTPESLEPVYQLRYRAYGKECPQRVARRYLTPDSYEGTKDVLDILISKDSRPLASVRLAHWMRTIPPKPLQIMDLFQHEFWQHAPQHGKLQEGSRLVLEPGISFEESLQLRMLLQRVQHLIFVAERCDLMMFVVRVLHIDFYIRTWGAQIISGPKYFDWFQSDGVLAKVSRDRLFQHLSHLQLPALDARQLKQYYDLKEHRPTSASQPCRRN